MKIAIIGDSFSSDMVAGSWIELLSKDHKIENYSQRSISQYRIFNILSNNLPSVLNADVVILWHTTPDRVYINDTVEFPTRRLQLHRYADLVAADSLESVDANWKNFVKAYYRVFYNQEQQQTYYHLMVEKIKFTLIKKKIIHCSGFDLNNIDPDIKSFKYLLDTNPGNINHFNLSGNLEVLNYINSKL